MIVVLFQVVMLKLHGPYANATWLLPSRNKRMRFPLRRQYVGPIVIIAERTNEVKGGCP